MNYSVIFSAILFLLPTLSFAQFMAHDPYPGDTVEYQDANPGGGSATTTDSEIRSPGNFVTQQCLEGEGRADPTREECICFDESRDNPLTQWYIDQDCDGIFNEADGYLGEAGSNASGFQANADIDRQVTNATEANPIFFGSTLNDGVEIFHDTTDDIPTTRSKCNGSNCQDLELKPGLTGGNVIIASSAKTPLFAVSDTGVVTHDWKRTIPFMASGWEVEGACTDPATYTVGDDIGRYVQCPGTASVGNCFQSKVALGGSAKAGEPINFRLSGLNANASPSGSADFNVTAKCESNIKLAFGGDTPVSVTFTTQDALATSTAVNITPTGSCGPFSTLSVRACQTVAGGDNDTQLDDVHWLDFVVLITAERLTDE